MEYYNFQSRAEKCTTKDIDLEIAPDINTLPKQFCQCQYCKTFQVIDKLDGYICNGCKKHVTTLTLFYVYQCKSCESFILHLDGSMIICPQCKKYIATPVPYLPANLNK